MQASYNVMCNEQIQYCIVPLLILQIKFNILEWQIVLFCWIQASEVSDTANSPFYIITSCSLTCLATTSPTTLLKLFKFRSKQTRRSENACSSITRLYNIYRMKHPRRIPRNNMARRWRLGDDSFMFQRNNVSINDTHMHIQTPGTPIITVS